MSALRNVMMLRFLTVYLSIALLCQGNARADDGLESLRQVAERVDQLDDYSCMIVLRDRVDGELSEQEHWRLKVRKRPAALHLIHLATGGRKLLWKDQALFDGEVLQGWSNHPHGFGLVKLKTTGILAKMGHRHPMTVWRMTDVMDRTFKQLQTHAGWTFNRRRGASINKRPCTVLSFVYERQALSPTASRVDVYVEQETGLPMGFIQYGWPVGGSRTSTP